MSILYALTAGKKEKDASRKIFFFFFKFYQISQISINISHDTWKYNA